MSDIQIIHFTRRGVIARAVRSTAGKPREIYKETMKAGAGNVRKELLPARLPYMPEGWVVDAIEVRAAGKLDDGREFQDVRVFTREEGS